MKWLHDSFTTVPYNIYPTKIDEDILFFLI